MKNNKKGFAGIGILIVIIAVLAIGGGAYYIGRNFKQDNRLPVAENNLPEKNQLADNNTQINLSDKKTEEFKNTEIGFTFNYFKDFGEIDFKNGKGTTGKNFFGMQGCEEKSVFCMFLGGVTSNFTFPGELNANEVSSYPTNEKLQSLAQNGYKNEKKVNSKGEEYVLIYGKKEIDMGYIGEGQVVAILKLKSSADFKALGFMFIRGDLDIFLKVIDSVDILDKEDISTTYTIEVYSNNSSSGADRNYNGELTFLNGKLISGFQDFYIGEGSNCTTDCERKTECIIKNQQWVGKNGGECTIEKYISLTKEGIEKQIKAKEIIPSEDFSNCHRVVCYRIKK